MGNSPPTGGLRLGNSDCPFTASVERSIAIEFTGWLLFEQLNEECWRMTHRAAGLLHSDEDQPFTIPDSKRDYFINDTNSAYGDNTRTIFDIYERGKTKGLVVRKYKRRSKDKDPYTATVAHYCVNTENGEDVDLSMVVKRIRVLNNCNFDFAVDGPEKHPASALLCMFDEVRRTKAWKPIYCYHCVNNIIQRQRACLWQSESEDSDKDNVSAPPLQASGRNARSIVSNDGRFWDNNNANIFINRFYGR